MSRLCSIVAVAAFLFGVGAVTADIQKGLSRADVVAALGEPQGLIASGDYERLTYERGFVELREGRVSAYELMGEAELENHRVQMAIRREEQLRRAEEQRLARIERGRDRKEQMLGSIAYARASGAEKVELLRRFRRSYPEVDIFDMVEPAMEQKRAEVKVQEEAERIARLEERIEEAEWRAQQAEWSASAARANAQDAMRMNYYFNNRHVGQHWHHQPRGFGISVGYDSPDVRVRYNSGGGFLPGQGQHTFRNVGSGTAMHSVAGKRLRSTSATARFNDGLD